MIFIFIHIFVVWSHLLLVLMPELTKKSSWNIRSSCSWEKIVLFLQSTCLLPCAYLAVCANNSCLRWWDFSVFSIIALFKFLYAPSSTSFYDINELDYVTSEDILKVDDNWIEIIHARSWNEFGSPLLNMSSEWIISQLHLFHFLDIFVDEKFFSLLREH